MTITISTVPTPILTREDHDPGEGYPDLIRDLRIAAGAPSRHESRVRAAERELASLVGVCAPDDREVELDDEQIRQAKLIAQIELHGIGGDLGLGRGLLGTARMSWARKLGKGRRHASDGDAWDAAIAYAFKGDGPELGQVTPALVVSTCDSLPAEDLLWPQTYAMDQAVAASDPDVATAWYGAAVRLAVDEIIRGRDAGVDPLTRDGERPRWRDALLAEAARAIKDHGLGPYNDELPDDVYQVDLPAPAPTPEPRVEIVSRRLALPEITGSVALTV